MPKEFQNEQSKTITEQGGKILERAMPIMPIPQALTNQSKTTNSSQNQSSGNSEKANDGQNPSTSNNK